MRLGIFTLVFLLINSNLLLALAVKEKADKRTSVAARQNPIVREYFKQRALSLQPSLADNGSKRNLDALVDFLIDDFTDKTLDLTDRMMQAAGHLRQLRSDYLAGKDDDGADRAFLEGIQEQVQIIRSTAKDLQSRLELLLLGQRVDVKSIDDSRPQHPDSASDDAISLYSLITRFKNKIDDFFFPRSNAISIEELRTASFPILLKKIERRAEALEETVKKNLK